MHWLLVVLPQIGRKSSSACKIIGLEDGQHPGKLRKYQCCPTGGSGDKDDSKNKKKKKISRGIAIIDEDDDDDDFVQDDEFIDDDDDSGGDDGDDGDGNDGPFGGGGGRWCFESRGVGGGQGHALFAEKESPPPSADSLLDAYANGLAPKRWDARAPPSAWQCVSLPPPSRRAAFKPAVVARPAGATGVTTSTAQPLSATPRTP